MLKKRAIEYIEAYGTGSTASRLVSGNYDCIEKVEGRIADLLGQEAGLIFNSGFQTNVSILPALTDKETLILSDWLNHNSIIQGALLSRCHVARFRHNDLEHLIEILRETRDRDYSRIVIVTESLFSMDGDQSDVDSLIEISGEYDALLIVDDAHAVGVLGEKGMGLASGKNVGLVMGTFSKAGGSFGAYIACNKKTREYLINFCYGFIYTTALPPPVIGSIDAALELMPSMDKERGELLRKAEFLRSSLNNLGFNTGRSTTQIIPVIVGDEVETLRLSKWLEDNGILAITFRPPTVAKGESRIRLALSLLHEQEHLDRLIDIFKGWRPNG